MPSNSPVKLAADAAAEARSERATQRQTLRNAITKAQPGFADALPSHVSVDRFIRAAFTALNTVPRLVECTQDSVMAGLMQAAQLGLEVSDVRGQCYLIPRRDSRDGGVYKATFQLGYRGMIDLAARSGITVDAEELHENDHYDFQLGTRRYLIHRPTLGARGESIAYYATATFADRREPAFVIMGRAEIEDHRDKFASTRTSKGVIVGPWVEHFDAMARKTVIRALLNYLPVSVELREAMHNDAIDTTASELTKVEYGTTFELPPEDVDARDPDDALDPTDAIEVPPEPDKPTT